MKDKIMLTEGQLQEAASRMSEVFRAAMLGKSLTGYDVCLSGVAPEELCHPLTQEQLTAIRSCTRFARREVSAVCCPDAWNEQEGLRTFRVRYAVDGNDADGNAVSVEAEGAVGLLCGCIGGELRETLNIRDVEPCLLQPDGSARRQGWLQRSLRRWLRGKRREGISEGAVNLLGEVVEFVLEVIFDG